MPLCAGVFGIAFRSSRASARTACGRRRRLGPAELLTPSTFEAGRAQRPSRSQSANSEITFSVRQPASRHVCRAGSRVSKPQPMKRANHAKRPAKSRIAPMIASTTSGSGVSAFEADADAATSDAGSPPAGWATGGGVGAAPGLADGVGAELVAPPPPAPLLGAPVPPEAVVLVPPALDLAHAPDGRSRRACDSALGKSDGYRSMSFGIWCCASRSVLAECEHLSICPSDR